MGTQHNTTQAPWSPHQSVPCSTSRKRRRFATAPFQQISGAHPSSPSTSTISLSIGTSAWLPSLSLLPFPSHTTNSIPYRWSQASSQSSSSQSTQNTPHSVASQTTHSHHQPRQLSNARRRRASVGSRVRQRAGPTDH